MRGLTPDPEKFKLFSVHVPSPRLSTAQADFSIV